MALCIIWKGKLIHLFYNVFYRYIFSIFPSSVFLCLCSLALSFFRFIRIILNSNQPIICCWWEVVIIFWNFWGKFPISHIFPNLPKSSQIFPNIPKYSQRSRIRLQYPFSTSEVEAESPHTLWKIIFKRVRVCSSKLYLNGSGYVPANYI